ncbi:c-type cytochrome [Mucisphaera sp.]|uniref:c-type cytochrome n=1 Tax=Mucisphaera sp. TaxID=2913024 RepID=UPI003D0E0B1A
MRALLLWLLMGALLVGCHEEGEPDPSRGGALTGWDREVEQQADGGFVSVEEGEVLVLAGEDLLWGAELYQASCAGCHGADGQGAGGAYPSLVGTEVVTGDPERLIRMTLHGVGVGPQALPASGDYADIMPGVGYLSDEEVAGIVSYVRASWGNAAGLVTEDEVAVQR